MCLSTIYSDASSEPVGVNIASIHSLDGRIVAVDVMGRKLELDGVIEDVDLLQNIIRVRRLPETQAR